MSDENRDRLVLEGDFEGRRVRTVLHRAAPDPTIRKWHFRFFRDEIEWGDGVII